jgi:hypothetical protein
LAPQTGLERPTFWLTAIAYSRCDLIPLSESVKRMPSHSPAAGF